LTGLTVVIATFNRPERLRRTLDALAAAADAFGGGCNIVIADNGEERLAEDAARGVSATYVRSRRGNKSAALNAGIASVKTGWLAFTDDDTVPDREWLATGMKYAAEHGLNVVGGRVVPGDVGDGLPGWLRGGRNGKAPRGPALVSYEPMAESGVLGVRAPVPLGANLFIKKNVFEKYGGYDEDLWVRCGSAALGCEDAEFGMRIRAAGESIGYCAEAVVVHPVYDERASVRAHLRWAYRNGIREAILFAKERLSLPGALRRVAGGAFRCALRLLGGCPAGAVCEMMAAAQALGQCAGRRRVGRKD